LTWGELYTYSPGVKKFACVDLFGEARFALSGLPVKKFACVDLLGEARFALSGLPKGNWQSAIGKSASRQVGSLPRGLLGRRWYPISLRGLLVTISMKY